MPHSKQQVELFWQMWMAWLFHFLEQLLQMQLGLVPEHVSNFVQTRPVGKLIVAQIF